MQANPIQPQFKIRVYNQFKSPTSSDTFNSQGSNIGSSEYDFIDVEQYVSMPVVYEEQASLLNTLSFSIDKFADVLLYKMHIGARVIMWGGYYTDDNSGVRQVFNGTITRIRTQFPNNGRISFSVECMEYGFNQLGKDDFQYYTYPDKDSKRSFANGKTQITLRQVIEGIATEKGIKIGEIDLPPTVANTIFTNKNPEYQKQESDWKFLKRLAQNYGCALWTSLEKGESYLYFKDLNKVKVNAPTTDISFLYIPQGQQGYYLSGSLKDSEVQTFPLAQYSRPRILRDLSVDEDISMAYAVRRTATYFNKETGEFTEAISETTLKDGKKVLTFYEFDESRVEYISKVDRELADLICKQGADKLQWSSGCEDPEDEDPHYARYYYRIVKVVDEEVAVFDTSFMGITLSATCNMDLNIQSQRCYAVRGILRYSSQGQQNTNYYLRGLRHVWDKSGTHTELDMIL